MSEPEEPFILPVGGPGLGGAKWVAVGAVVLVSALGGWLAWERAAESRAQAEHDAQQAREEDERLRVVAERRARAGSGTPLASAHKPPPGWKPPKKRVPSEELFAVPRATGGLPPTPLPGKHFGIDLPPTWEHRTSGKLMIIRAPEGHFNIVASAGTHADDGNTQTALDQIGAVNCNWRRGDGPKHGQLGAQRIPAFFNEGVCAHTDGYGLIWIVRVFAGDDDVTSLVARYSPQAGEDAEDVLLDVLRSISPIE